MKISLLQNEIEGRDLQENFRRIQLGLAQDVMSNAQWKLFSLDFKKDGRYAFDHGLTFVPQDVITTRITGLGTIAYAFTEFTDTKFFVDVAGTSISDPLRVKFLLGAL